MVYRLRPHHVKDLNKLLSTGRVRMFISNLIWYGWKEALFRDRYLRKIRNDKNAKIRMVNGREDDICRSCRHFAYCNTQFVSLRDKRMGLYEKLLLNGKPHRPYLKDSNLVREAEASLSAAPSQPPLSLLTSLLLGRGSGFLLSDHGSVEEVSQPRASK